MVGKSGNLTVYTRSYLIVHTVHVYIHVYAFGFVGISDFGQGIACVATIPPTLKKSWLLKVSVNIIQALCTVFYIVHNIDHFQLMWFEC